MIKRHTKPTPEEPAGRHRRQGGHGPHLERAAVRRQDGRGHAHQDRRTTGGSKVRVGVEVGNQVPRRWDVSHGRRRRRSKTTRQGRRRSQEEGARREGRRPRAGGGKKKAAEPAGPAPKYKREKPPRLEEALRHARSRAAMMKEFSYSTVMQVPRDREGLGQHGPRQGQGRAQDHRQRRRGAQAHHRPVAGRVARQEGHRGLQAPQGPEDRRDGHAAPRAHVGVPRPPRATSRCRASATSAACRRAGSTAAATSPWACREQIIFPEIEYDKIDSIKGMNISIVTTAKTDAEGRALLAHLGMPFRQADADRYGTGAAA